MAMIGLEEVKHMLITQYSRIRLAQKQVDIYYTYIHTYIYVFINNVLLNLLTSMYYL